MEAVKRLAVHMESLTTIYNSTLNPIMHLGRESKNFKKLNALMLYSRESTNCKKLGALTHSISHSGLKINS